MTGNAKPPFPRAWISPSHDVSPEGVTTGLFHSVPLPAAALQPAFLTLCLDDEKTQLALLCLPVLYSATCPLKQPLIFSTDGGCAFFPENLSDTFLLKFKAFFLVLPLT